jgi:hypothetical protein
VQPPERERTAKPPRARSQPKDGRQFAPAGATRPGRQHRLSR